MVQEIFAHQRANRRSVALSQMSRRAGDADLGNQRAVVAELPADEIDIAVRVVRIRETHRGPNDEHLAGNVAEHAEVVWSRFFLVHHHDGGLAGRGQVAFAIESSTPGAQTTIDAR